MSSEVAAAAAVVDLAAADILAAADESVAVDFSATSFTGHFFNIVDEKKPRGCDRAEWLERLTVNAVVATVLGSIPASSDTVKSEGRQILNIVHKKSLDDDILLWCLYAVVNYSPWGFAFFTHTSTVEVHD
jgi:hypothetical protein